MALFGTCGFGAVFGIVFGVCVGVFIIIFPDDRLVTPIGFLFCALIVECLRGNPEVLPGDKLPKTVVSL